MNKEKKYWLDQPGSVQRLLKWLYWACAVLFGLDFVINRHIYHPWETLFGFYAVFGFVACALLVLVAREMRKVLMRKEDYYDDR